MVTKRYNTEKEHNVKEGIDGGDSSKLYYDAKGNKEYGDAVTGETVTNGITHYYGTTFTNSGKAPAYVNLYLKDFTNSPTVKIGTLQPNLTHKGLSSSVSLINDNSIRIYCQFANANNWRDSDATNYLIYKTKAGATGRKTITSHITAAASGTALRDTQTAILHENIENTFYVDLPGDATEFYFATDGNNSGFNTNDNTVTQPWYRTKTITNIHAEVCYYLTGVADDTTWNAAYEAFNFSGGISVKTYFDTVTINKNQHAYVTLNKGTNYTGSSCAYTLTEVKDNNNNALTVSNNTCSKVVGQNTIRVISINGNTGYITTADGYYTNYTATITTTITGSLGDSTTVTTTVSNPSSLAGVPVALNVEVPGKTTNENGDEVNGTAEIVWYIDNSATSSDVEFAGIYYTK